MLFQAALAAMIDITVQNIATGKINWSSVATTALTAGITYCASSIIYPNGVNGFWKGAVIGSIAGATKYLLDCAVNSRPITADFFSSTASGAIGGGLTSGIAAKIDGRDFWTGNLPQPDQIQYYCGWGEAWYEENIRTESDLFQIRGSATGEWAYSGFADIPFVEIDLAAFEARAYIFDPKYTDVQFFQTVDVVEDGVRKMYNDIVPGTNGPFYTNSKRFIWAGQRGFHNVMRDMPIRPSLWRDQRNFLHINNGSNIQWRAYTSTVGYNSITQQYDLISTMRWGFNYSNNFIFSLSNVENNILPSVFHLNSLYNSLQGLTPKPWYLIK